MTRMARRAKVIRFPGSPPASQPREPDREPVSPASLVEVRRCGDQAEALVVRGLLDSEGIRAILRGKLVQSVHPFSVGDQGEVIVLVPEPDAGRARAVLARSSIRPGEI